MKTVKVRIALEIDPEGKWHACGFQDAGSWNEIMDSFDQLDNSARHWIEAEVPVPAAEPAAIAGKAVEVEPA